MELVLVTELDEAADQVRQARNRWNEIAGSNAAYHDAALLELRAAELRYGELLRRVKGGAVA